MEIQNQSFLLFIHNSVFQTVLLVDTCGFIIYIAHDTVYSESDSQVLLGQYYLFCLLLAVQKLRLRPFAACAAACKTFEDWICSLLHRSRCSGTLPSSSMRRWIMADQTICPPLSVLKTIHSRVVGKDYRWEVDRILSLHIVPIFINSTWHGLKMYSINALLQTPL